MHAQPSPEPPADPAAGRAARPGSRGWAPPARRPGSDVVPPTAAPARPGRARSWLLLAGLCLSALGGCDDEGAAGGFEVQVVAEPVSQGNAPLTLTLRAASNGPLTGEYAYAWRFGDGAESTDEAPTHTYTTPGEYAAAVEISVGGQRGRAETAITVAPPTDLAVGEVAITPRRVAAGGELRVAYALRNDGAGALGRYRVRVFAATEPVLTASAITLFEATVEGDPTSDDSGERTLAVPADFPSGDFFVGVVVDPEARIGDLDRSNNLAFADLTLQVRNPTDNGPDLVSCGLAVPAFDELPPDQVPVAQLGDQIEVRVCAANLGNQPVAVGSYALFLVSDADPERRIEVGRRAGFALGSGDQETFEEIVDLPLADAAGLWRLQVELDPDDTAAEQREDNNLRERAGLIELAEPGTVTGIDLAVRALSADGDRVYWGQAITGALEVVNRGDTPVARAFVVRFFAAPLNGTEAVQVGSLNLQTFPAGGEERFDLQLAVSQRITPGQYRLRVEIDPSNSVGDVNPSNNRRTLTDVLTLGGEPDYDLVATGASFSPMAVEAGASIAVRATLSNPGADPSGGFEAAVVLSADAVLDAGDVIIGRFNLDSLAPGGSVDFDQSVEVPTTLDQQVPSWRVAVVVDPANRLSGERSEENNVAFAPEPLTVSGAQGGCAEDVENEPNNLPGQAVARAPGVAEGLGLCDDADWFRVAVPAGSGLEATVAWAAGAGPVALRLTDVAGTPLATGEGLGDARTAFVAPSGLAREVLVHLSAASRLQYDLDLNLLAAGASPSLRPRLLSVSPALAVASAPVEVSFEVVNLGGAPAPAFEAAIELVPPGGGAVQALDTAPVAPIEGGDQRVVRRTVTLPAGLANGLYRVRATLDPTATVAEADRTDNVVEAALRIDADQACPVDPFEPNQSGLDGGVARAAALPPGVHPDLATCDDDDDWYAVTLEAAQRLRADLAFTNAEGDLELELYDTDGTTRLARSAGFADRESVELLRAPRAGDYFVRVLMNPSDALNRANTYTLTVVVDAANACADDGFEPNGTRESAAVLPDGAHDLVLCPGDQDWFRFNIPAGNVVSFQVAGGAANVRIALFSPTGELVAEDGRRIAHQAVVSGLHTLRVQVEAAERTPYALTVAGVSGVDLEVLAVRLSSASVAGGDGLRVDADFTNNRGDTARNVLVRYLLSADALPSAEDRVLGEATVPAIEGGLVSTLSQRLRVPADAPAGARFVVVDLDPLRAVPDLRPGNNRGAAPLNVSPQCSDDDARDNEGPATATVVPLDDGVFDDGVICPFTEDWFRLSGVAPGAVTVGLSFTHALGDLDLFAYDDDLVLLAEGATEGDGEAVQFEHTGGDLLIRVDGFIDAQNSYNLTWTLP